MIQRNLLDTMQKKFSNSINEFDNFGSYFKEFR